MTVLTDGGMICCKQGSYINGYGPSKKDSDVWIPADRITSMREEGMKNSPYTIITTENNMENDEKLTYINASVDDCLSAYNMARINMNVNDYRNINDFCKFEV